VRRRNHGLKILIRQSALQSVANDNEIGPRFDALGNGTCVP
jgi:hypothetical protein